MYKHIEIPLVCRSLCSLELVDADSTPLGNAITSHLFEEVREIQKGHDDGIGTVDKKMAVCQLYVKQNRQHGNVRQNVKKGCERLIRLLEVDPLDN